MLISLSVNVSFSSTIMDSLCPNTKGSHLEIKFICDSNVHNTDPHYYSCYREVFEQGGSHFRAIETGDCRGIRSKNFGCG